MLEILKEIAAHKREEARSLDLAALKAQWAQQQRQRADGPGATGDRSLSARLAQGFGVIAEIKRQSPSVGVMRATLNPAHVAAGYEQAGAAAISVLTDQKYFGGSLDDLRAVRQRVALPLLRKDFTVDRRQLYEAALAGADLILLIVRMLTPEQLRGLNEESRELGLAVLVETHDQRDLDAAHAALGHIALLGVNNRDLDTLEISVQRCVDLYPHLPPHDHAIAESGLHTPADVALVRGAGYGGALIGQALMQHGDPAARLRELLGE